MGIWNWVKFILGLKKENTELSYSRIQAYKKCPWLFKLIYLDGQRSSPSGPMALGMSLHRALAHYLGGQNTTRTLDRLLQIYDEVWVNEGFSSTQQTLDSYDAGRKMLENFFEVDRQRQHEVLATEKDFSIDWDGIQFMGSIDRIDRTQDGTYEIIEYKTQGESWSPSRVAMDLQLTLYEIGAREGLGLSPLRLKYFFLSDGTIIPTHRTEEQKKTAREIIFETARKIRLGKFEPNSSFCERCEFGSRCSKSILLRETAKVST